MAMGLLHRPRINAGPIAAGPLATGLIAGGLLASVLVGPAVARAGSISGSASTRERIALLPDAVFAAVPIDRAIADDPEVGGQQQLQGGREALRKLDLEGQPLTTGGNDRLERLAAAEPIEPRLHLAGMFRYMADAASIRLCATGANLPVAMEDDYLPLERAYLAARPADAPGEPMLVNLKGLISKRPSAEPGRGLVLTLVVKRFVAIHPGQNCPEPAASK